MLVNEGEFPGAREGNSCIVGCSLPLLLWYSGSNTAQKQTPPPPHLSTSLLSPLSGSTGLPRYQYYIADKYPDNSFFLLR